MITNNQPRDVSPRAISARVLAIVENYVAPGLRRQAANEITDVLIDVQQDTAEVAMGAYRNGIQQALREGSQA